VAQCAADTRDGAGVRAVWTPATRLTAADAGWPTAVPLVRRAQVVSTPACTWTACQAARPPLPEPFAGCPAC